MSLGSGSRGCVVAPFLVRHATAAAVKAQFGHCRVVTPGRVFPPTTKLPRIWRSMCSWRRVVDLPEANQLLKYIPEAVTTPNSMLRCTNKMPKNNIFFCAQLEKTKTTLVSTRHTRGKEPINIKRGW